MLRTLQREARPATGPERQQLAAWSSWGAVPQVFDEHRTEHAQHRAQLRELLDDVEWEAAARTTINAHYTQPSYAAAVWDAVSDLGFTAGTVLEPGCGSGTFIALAPQTAAMIGVELDPVTAAIAATLNPQHLIRAESFARTLLPQQVDAVVGNVPFSEVALHDPVHNPSRLSMHNHFVSKSLAVTKPGGVVAVLTSRYTMDAQNPAARRELAELGELLGAVRLPNGAHARTAGTDVVTDLLVLRRHDEQSQRTPADVYDPARWEQTTPASFGDRQVRVNQYFLDHPEHVLGRLGARAGRFGPELTVRPHEQQPVDEQLQVALATITAQARQQGRSWSPDPAQPNPLHGQAAARAGSAPAEFVGHLRRLDSGVFVQRASDGRDEAVVVPTSQAAELGELLHLRDLATGLLQAEASTLADTPQLAAMRATLNDAYDAYATAHGPLNRYTLRRTGRLDDAGQERHAQIRPPVMARFAGDPHAATVLALESFDAQTQTAVKAAIFTERVVAPRAPRTGADTPADALAIALDTGGPVELSTIARLLGEPEHVARQRLTGLVYDDPETGRIVPAAEYLSGDVRAKLTVARQAAATTATTARDADPSSSRGGVAEALSPPGSAGGFAENVAALTAVLPTDLGPADIDARLGAAWIDVEDVQAFLRETLATTALTVERTSGADWKVRGVAHGVLATSTWGTDRVPAHRLAESLLRQRPIRVMDTGDDGEQIFNPTETTAAQEKATALSDRFAEWVWEEPARADRLSRVYNERFNSIVVRSYADTAHMRLPGLATTFTPRPHQLEAVARMIAEPAAGLYHEVGAGKTAEMAIGVMELRRLQLARKPAIVVPNHMLEQFSREFLQLYPQARVLAASIHDVQADRRRLFVARAATGDWDAVIMTRTAFERLPVSADEEERYLRAELEPMRAALQARAAEADGPTRKRVEKALLASEERLKGRLDRVRDAGVTFEQTGIDYLVVDELHDYKNLATASNIPDANIAGSARATDLHMKTEYLRRTHGGRCITGATATPIANSVTEAYVMQRYLRPDLLTGAGIPDFDTWAATFGQTVTDLEMSPDGGSWRMKTRFAKFRNIPEFLRMWHVAADIKTAEDLQLPVPVLTERPDGRRGAHTVVVQPTTATQAYVQDLGRRAENVRAGAVDPREDNMLKISSDGRAAALDMRLLTSRGHDLPTSFTTSSAGSSGSSSSSGPDSGALFELDLADVAAEPPTKVDVAADTIARIWRTNADRTYTDPRGGQHPRAGALQLVFSDLGTPGEGWNVYDELRRQLVDRGVPAGQIAFMHEAATDRDKARLFDRARTGDVQVLLGSTAKMGVGTNVQARAVALHHLDCPWRPADLAQREGRILRQGNQNDEVSIYRYVTENTFDTYLWQTVERKAGFIGQIMRGTTSREIDDIGQNALDYNEVKALASGNPLLLETAKAEAEVARLERLRRAHERQQVMLQRRVGQLTEHRDQLTGTIEQLQDGLRRRDVPADDRFRMLTHPPANRHTGTDPTPTTTSRVPDLHGTRTDAAAALTAVLRSHLADPQTRFQPVRDFGQVAELAQLPIRAVAQRDPDGLAIRLSVDRLPGTSFTVHAADLDTTGLGLITRLENRVNGLERTLTEQRSAYAAALEELRRAEQGSQAPFKHHDALLAARSHRDRATADLARSTQPDTTEHPGTPSGEQHAGPGNHDPRPSRRGDAHGPRDEAARTQPGRRLSARLDQQLSGDPAAEHASAAEGRRGHGVAPEQPPSPAR